LPSALASLGSALGFFFFFFLASRLAFALASSLSFPLLLLLCFFLRALFPRPFLRARVSLARCSSLAFALALFPFVLFCAFLRARFFVRVFSRSLFPCLFPSALFPSRSFPSARSAPVFRFVESG
jgi:hypothetical protein